MFFGFKFCTYRWWFAGSFFGNPKLVGWLPPILPPITKPLMTKSKLMFNHRYFFQREIFELRRPSIMKFCTMISSRPTFVILVQNFGAQKKFNFRGEKHAKFSLSSDFRIWWRISTEWMRIFKIRQVHYWLQFFLHSAKKNFVKLSTNYRDPFCVVIPTQFDLFRRLYFGFSGDSVQPYFYVRYRITKSC